MEEITIENPFTERDIQIADIDIDDPFVQPSTKVNAAGPVNLRKRRCPSPVDIEEAAITDPFSESDDDTCSTTSTNSTCSSSAFNDDIPDDLYDDVLGNDSEMIDVNLEDLPGMNSEPLYADSQATVSIALAILLSWFAAYPGVSKEALSCLLFLLHQFILPAGNRLPNSYANVIKLIKSALVPEVLYHCCINDCVVFRGINKDCSECPVCKEPRYYEGRDVPRKTFKYLPLGPRLRRLFRSARTSQLLQSHANTSQTSTQMVADIHQTEVWKKRYSPTGEFGGDARSLSLAVCADGTNPFSKEKTSYSMWPIVVSILNLPSHLRRLPGYLQLVGIIPGKSEPKNTDPYMDVLVDEILELNGTVLFDAFKNEKFSLKANIVLHILDYPGQNKLFHCHGAGAYAGCCYCTIRGEYSPMLSKTVYLNHRNFLPATDRLRLEKTGFPSKKKPRNPPKIKDQHYIIEAQQRYVKATDPKTKTDPKSVARRTGFKGSYALQRLPHHDRYLNTPTEPMHLIKNVVEHLVKLLAGVEDSKKVRRHEEHIGRFRKSWVTDESSALPTAPFRLQSTEIAITSQRAKQVQVPLSIEWRPKPIFSGKIGKMNSHTYKELVSTRILKYTLRGLLGRRQRITLFFFLDTLAALCAEVINMAALDALEYDVHKSLSLLERDFPVSLHVSVFHLLHHMPVYLRRFGPVYTHWMYPLERFNSWIIRRVHNRRFPEATVIETYRLYDWAHSLEIEGLLPNNAILHPIEPNIVESKMRKLTKVLSDAELKYLKQCYQDILPQYKMMCERYQEERKKAQVYHHLQQFPTMLNWTPSSGPPLTITEQGMRSISTEIHLLDRFIHNDSFGRKVVLTSMSSDTANTKSSYVYIKQPNSSYLFGQINFIFSHTFLDSHVFAFVKWFSPPEKDEESGILFVNTQYHSIINPIVPISELCGPIVTALDGNKLWILSFLS